MFLNNNIQINRITIFIVILLIVIILFIYNTQDKENWEINNQDIIHNLDWEDSWIKNQESINKEIIENNHLIEETGVNPDTENNLETNTNTDLVEENKNELIDKEEIVDSEIIKNDLEISTGIKINNTSFSSNINNLIEISWEEIVNISEIQISWMTFIPKFIEWVVYVWIDSNTIPEWEHKIYIKFKNWELLEYEENMKFIFNVSKVNLANITPNVIKNDIDRNIVLQWNWFSKILSIQLSNNIILKSTNFDIINDNVMSLLIPKDLAPWKYKLNIMDIEWIYESDLEIEITQ